MSIVVISATGQAITERCALETEQGQVKSSRVKLEFDQHEGDGEHCI